MIVNRTSPIRAFFAIDLPLSVKTDIATLIAKLKKNHHREPIRWTKPHNLHITLQFLAAVVTDDLPQLIANVRSEIEALSRFYLTLDKLELFPTSYLPRIISLSLGSQAELAEIARCIGRGIVASGYEIETRPFRGHLTLARLNRIKNPFSLIAMDLPTFDQIEVTEVILYKSEPSQSGSSYIPLERFVLKPKT